MNSCEIVGSHLRWPLRAGVVIVFAVGGTSFLCSVEDAAWKPGDVPRISPGGVSRMTPDDRVPLFWSAIIDWELAAAV